MIDTQNRHAPRASALLRWMYARGVGSSNQYNDAIEYLYGDRAMSFRVALRLSALGYVEFDWSGTDFRWKFIPPCFYGAPLFDGNGGLGLCGLLPQRDREFLIGQRVEVIDDVDYFFDEETLPRLFVRDGPRARRAIEELGIPITPLAFQDLRLRLPAVSDLILAGELLGLPEEATRFNSQTGKFEADYFVNGPYEEGCYRIESYPRPMYMWLSLPESDAPVCYRCDRTVGMWASYGKVPRKTMSLRGGKLRIPAFPSLPVLHERMLYLSGARCVAANRQNIDFDRVRYPVVNALAQKLPLELEKR